MVTLCAVNADGGVFLFRVDKNSRLENCCGEKIHVDELSKGAIIDINYRKFLFKEEDVHTVKTLKKYD